MSLNYFRCVLRNLFETKKNIDSSDVIFPFLFLCQFPKMEELGPQPDSCPAISKSSVLYAEQKLEPAGWIVKTI